MAVQTSAPVGTKAPEAGNGQALRNAAVVGLLVFCIGLPLLWVPTEVDAREAVPVLARAGWLVAIAALAAGAAYAIEAMKLAALRIAGHAALVTAGLTMPIVAILTDQSRGTNLDLIARFQLVGVFCAIAFAGGLLYHLRQQQAAIQAAAARTTAANEAKGGGVLSRLSQVGPFALLVFALFFPIISIILSGWAGALKWIDNFGVQILIFIMLGWGLNVVVGLAGLLDLGYVAFYAVGAYSYALIAKYGMPLPVLSGEFPFLALDLFQLGAFGFWVLLPIAGLLAALWGVLLGFPVLRLRGDYLAIVTLAFGEIIRLVLINWQDFTNGTAGITNIPGVTLFGIPLDDSPGGLAARIGFTYEPLHERILLYYLILALALLTAAVTVKLRSMPVGRAWEALREDEIACRSLGINTVNTKLTAFAIGAMFAGFAGSFFAARQGFINPESFTFTESAQVLAIVILGGAGSLMGVVIAAAAIVGGFELLRELDFLKQIFGSGFDPTQYRALIFGLCMVLMMIVRPRGLIATREPTMFLKERKAIGAEHVKEGHG